MKRRNPYKKDTDLSKRLMDRIGWSAEEIQSFLDDVEEEEKVLGTKNEEMRKKKGITAMPGVVSPPANKWQTVGYAVKSAATNDLTPEQKARINKNRIRASYLRQQKKRYEEGSRVTKLEVVSPMVVERKDEKEKKKGEEEVVIEEDV